MSKLKAENMADKEVTVGSLNVLNEIKGGGIDNVRQSLNEVQRTTAGFIRKTLVTFAAVTSSVSVMEAIVSGIMDKWKLSRTKSAVIATVYSLVFGVLVCLGFNVLAFDIPLPNGSTGQFLDVMDYVSNSVLMPFVALVTCIFIGWIVKPKFIIDEVTRNGEKFGRKTLYTIMIKFIAPVILFILLLQAFGLL